MFPSLLSGYGQFAYERVLSGSLKLVLGRTLIYDWVLWFLSSELPPTRVRSWDHVPYSREPTRCRNITYCIVDIGCAIPESGWLPLRLHNVYSRISLSPQRWRYGLCLAPPRQIRANVETMTTPQLHQLTAIQSRSRRTTVSSRVNHNSLRLHNPFTWMGKELRAC